MKHLLQVIQRSLRTWALLLALPAGLSAQLLSYNPSEPEPQQLNYLKRSLSLLKSASASNRVSFRIMVYGQSISVGPWSDMLFDKLTASYPHVDFVTTNKAIGGFTAAPLSKASIADVAPWLPDLVILHCLGNDIKDYERLYDNIRSHSSTDVLVHADHIQSNTQADESLDLSDLGPDSIWVLRNYYWLPELANRFRFCWADIRTPWKQYLKENNLNFAELLEVDRIHCNEHGFALTAELIYEHLKPRPNFQTIDPFDGDLVKTQWVGPEFNWNGSELCATITGNRVDVIYDQSSAVGSSTYIYTLDDKSPSEVAELFGFDRASPAWAISWPGVLQVDSVNLPLEERWTLTVDSLNYQTGELSYTLVGSKTGFDGKGSNFSWLFTSNSGRVAIAGDSLMINLAYLATQQKPPADWKINFNCVRRALDEFTPKPSRRVGETSSETLFLSSKDRSRQLKIRPKSGMVQGIRGIRVYSPAGKATITPTQPSNLSRLLAWKRIDDSLEVEWPESWKGRLHTATNLTGAPDWKPISEPIQSENATNRVRVRSDGVPRFFLWKAATAP
jgi:hypothetical protein